MTDTPNQRQPAPYVNFPHGLHVQPWGDGVMVTVLDQGTRHGMTAFLGHEGLVRLFQWCVEAGILQGEVVEEMPNPRPDWSPTMVAPDGGEGGLDNSRL